MDKRGSLMKSVFFNLLTNQIYWKLYILVRLCVQRWPVCTVKFLCTFCRSLTLVLSILERMKVREIIRSIKFSCLKMFVQKFNLNWTDVDFAWSIICFPASLRKHNCALLIVCYRTIFVVKKIKTRKTFWLPDLSWKVSSGLIWCFLFGSYIKSAESCNLIVWFKNLKFPLRTWVISHKKTGK